MWEFFLCNVEITSVEKKLKTLNVAKDSTIDWISSKFLKDGALVIVTPLISIINVLIKIDPFLRNAR